MSTPPSGGADIAARCWIGLGLVPVWSVSTRTRKAVAIGQQLERADARFRIVAARFDCLDRIVAEEGRQVDGLLMDLGVSSPQLDDAERGFSFLRDGPLDMRMNPEAGISAAEWLARADEKDIADVLYRFGEEKNRAALPE